MHLPWEIIGVAEMPGLEPFLEPKTIAVIRVSNTRDRPGYMLVQNLVNSGFPGMVYAVPIDLGPINSPDVYEHAKEELLADENVDGIIFAVFFWLDDLLKISEILIKQVERDRRKQVTFCGASFTSVVAGIEKALGSLEEAGTPIYPSPERTVGALGALYRRQETLRVLSGEG